MLLAKKGYLLEISDDYRDLMSCMTSEDCCEKCFWLPECQGDKQFAINKIVSLYEKLGKVCREGDV